MPKFISETFLREIHRKKIKNHPILFMLVVFLSFMYIDIMYRYFNHGVLFDPDIIHILFIDLTLALLVMVLIGIIPTVAKKYVITLVMTFFVMMSFLYTVLGFESVVQTGHSLNIFSVFAERFLENFKAVYLVMFVPLFIGFTPIKVKYTVPKYMILVSLFIVTVFVGNWYLQADQYNNRVEAINNYERVYYNDEGTLLFARLGSNIGLIRNFFPEAEYNIKTESYVSETYKFIQPADRLNSYSDNYKNYNVVIIEIDGLDYMAVNKDVMPTLWSLSKTGMEFVNYFDKKTLNQNFEMITGTHEASNSLNTLLSYGQNSYPNALGNQFRNSRYFTTYIETQKSEFLFETDFIKQTGYQRYGDSATFGKSRLNALDLMTEAAPTFFEYDRFYTHIKFSDLLAKPMSYASDAEEITLDVPEDVLNYYSYANVVDQAIDRLFETLSVSGNFNRTVVIVASTGHPDYLEDDIIRQYSNGREGFNIDRIPFAIWDGSTNETITEPMGPANVPATLSNMFDLNADEYIVPDVFAPGQNVVAFNNRSWVSEAGYYDSTNQNFTVVDEKFLTDYLDEFIEFTNQTVYNRYLYSRILLENNYFALDFI